MVVGGVGGVEVPPAEGGRAKPGRAAGPRGGHGARPAARPAGSLGTEPKRAGPSRAMRR